MEAEEVTDRAFELEFVTSHRKVGQDGQAGEKFFGPKPLVLFILKSILNQAQKLKFKGSIAIK